MDATNILIIGNGFDLYHDLPTRYTDFLTFVSDSLGHSIQISFISVNKQ